MHDIPTVFGTGLIALDVIYGLDAETPRFHAGGTCGNVLAALSYLGWRSFPIGRLARDEAGMIVRTDLARWGIRQDFIELQPTASTPVIVEQIVRTKRGVPRHRFHLSCPRCGGWFPAFRPLREDTTIQAIPHLGRSHVFCADRVSKGIVRLAEHFADSGALICFEPCGTGDTKLFKRLLQLSHVVKYSQGRAKSFFDILQSARPLLQVETLGEDGLRYRSRLPGAMTKGWKKIDAVDVADVRDAAGSGDWTTAGLINCVGQGGASGFMQLDDDSLSAAFKQAQAMGAWNCQYEGARGGMYASSRANLQAFVASALNKTPAAVEKCETLPRLVSRALEFCPDCSPVKGHITESSSDVRTRGERSARGTASTRATAVKSSYGSRRRCHTSS